MKKIMFNDKFGLTKAVLEGRKTQTRRIVLERYANMIQDIKNRLISSNKTKEQINSSLSELGKTISPYKVGEIVAIAQNYKDCGAEAYYWKQTPGWTNKMFVKANLMPHRIEIERLRVERLQDISDEDCLKEGIYEDGGNDSFIPRYFYNYYNSNSDGFKTPQLAYADLINKIACNSTWESNPWVFVYDFKLIK